MFNDVTSNNKIVNFPSSTFFGGVGYSFPNVLVHVIDSPVVDFHIQADLTLVVYKRRNEEMKIRMKGNLEVMP